MQNSLNQIVGETQTTSEAQITLHNLESSAQTYRALYDNFLQRYMKSDNSKLSRFRKRGLSPPRHAVEKALHGLASLAFDRPPGLLQGQAEIRRTSAPHYDLAMSRAIS